MIPPRSAHRARIKTLAEGVAMLVSVIMLTGLTYLGVQWFADSIDSWFYQSPGEEKSAFSASLEAAASDMLEPQPAPQVQGALVVEPVPLVTEASQTDSLASISLAVQQEEQLVLQEKNSQLVLPIASLTKLMTAAIVLEYYDLNQPVVVSEAAMSQEGEQGVLKAGEVLSVKDLLYVTLLESSNRAAYALSEVVGPETFVRRMNAKASMLGLTYSHFVDPAGLQEQSVSTARDVALLTKYLVTNYPLFIEIIGTESYNVKKIDGQLHHVATNTNTLLGQKRVVGGKTGYTQAALGCYMIIQKNVGNDGYVIHVILGAQDRLAAMEKLIDEVK